MLLLVRTTPVGKVSKKTEGLSTLLVDMRQALGNELTVRPIRTMMNHATTEIFLDDLRVPAANLIGEEGQGFRYILSGMNAERILIAAECVGDAKWFLDRATSYARERSVFGRRINNRVENSDLPFRRRERAMSRFRRMETLQKFASIHANMHNHFNQERHLVDRQTYETRRSVVLAKWQSLVA